jgi:phage-related minor tail protein
VAKKKLTVEIAGDSKGLADTISGASSKLGEFGKAAGVAIGAVGAAVVGVGVGLFKVGESFDEAYDKIRIGTGATGDDLERFKDSVKTVFTSVPTDLGKASDAFVLLQQKTQGFGPDLEKTTEQMLELSRITKTDLTANINATQGAFNAWGVTLANQPALLDEMFRASQLTGTSVGRHR